MPEPATAQSRALPQIVLCAFVFIALLSGCEKSSETSKEKAAAPSASAAPAASAPAAGQAAPGQAAPGQAPGAPGDAAAAGAPPKPTIEVKDAGKDPKTVLRYQFVKGKTKTFTMKMSLAMNATMEGQPQQPMPPVEFEFGGKTLTLDVAADGTATRQTTFTTFAPKMPNLPPQIAAQMEADMKGIEGVVLLDKISARGQLESVEIKEAATQSPQVQQLLGNVVEGLSNTFLLLPETAVGVGARWESRTVMMASGAAVTQVGRFKVASMQGSKVALEIEIEQSADAKGVPAFPSGPGIETQLVSMDGKGTGTTTVDVGTLNSTGNVQIETKTVTRISAAPAPGAAPMPGATPGMPPQSQTSVLTTKVAVSIKMTD